MSSKEEVVVVGAGVIGCSIAYHLAKQGVSSQIIERDSIASQASGKAWALILPTARILLIEGRREPRGSLRPGLSLYQEGFQRISQLATELKEEGRLDIGFMQLSMIRVVFTEEEEKQLKERLFELENEGLIDELESQGFQAGWLRADDVRARIPEITPGVRGGMILPEFKVEPYRYTLALAQAAEAKGASIKQGKVVGFRSRGSRVTAVTLATGREVEADVVVLAMGPWSGQGTSWLGKEIPVMVSREQCLKVEVPEPFPPFDASVGRVSIIPQADSTVLFGRAWVHDPVDNFDDRPTEEAKISLSSAAVDLIPSLKEAKLVEHRAALEGWAPRGERALPILGLLPGWDNVYVAMRLGTTGIMLSPGVGRRVANLIVKGDTEEIPKLLSPARFE